MWQAFGHVGYFFILCAVSWSWGPSQVSSQLAHSQQIAMTEDDANDMELSGTIARGGGVNSEDVDIFRLEDDDDDKEDDDKEDEVENSGLEAV